jgi:5-methylcytosine-specific restriction enzyme A
MEEIEDIIAAAQEDSPDDEDTAEDSWTTEDVTTVAKQMDRHVFLYRETILPEKIQDFFSLEDLPPGKKRKVVLWQGNHRFDAFIERTIHKPPLTRMRWGQDFGSLLQKTYPEWYEYFKKSRSESEDTPPLFITRRQAPGEYDVAFDRVPVQGTAPEIEVPVRAGDIIDNETLRAIFRCSSSGTMRRSPGRNSLVLISDHTWPGCDDKWIAKTFHFTGIGLNGEPGLSFNQNKTLCESNENGTSLFLFEVFEPEHYTYTGEVELADNPYLSRQTDSEKKIRDVTVFPLKIRGNGHPLIPKEAEPETKEVIGPKKAQTLPPGQPLFPAEYSPGEGGSRGVASQVFDSDEIVAEYAKRRADGICQLCNRPAPFKDRNGEPFLEIHHIVPLAQGGSDIIGNVVALCPNCHRKMHELNLPADEVRLKNRVSARD